MAVRVTVWGENVHERSEEHVRALYPDGMHATIAAGSGRCWASACAVRTATLDQPEHGLPEAVLAETDVLTWWGHRAHDRVDDAVVERVHGAVLGGMGLLALHSAHYSKIFTRLLGTSCSLRWRNDGERELVWTVDPAHPIAAGVPQPLVIERRRCTASTSTSRRPTSSSSSARSRRRGVPLRLLLPRGRGRVFYFSPGDQEYPVYHHADVQRVLANAVLWAARGPTRTGARQAR